MRKITITYDFNYDKTTITFTLKEITDEYYSSLERQYDFKEYLNSTLLYNKLLDDFDAEYDDEIAYGLSELVNQIFNEKED